MQLDKQLLDLYSRELAFLRSAGAEFAKTYPKIAGRLGGLDDLQACPDPFVERLLEGFAFLAARVQLKLNGEFPRFTQSLIETAYPHYLAPLPSMCIVQFEPDTAEPALIDGFKIGRHATLWSLLGRTEQTKCQYRTAHDVNLWPIQISQADYYVRELASLDVPIPVGVKAGLRIRIQSLAGVPLNQMALDSLTLHLVGSGEFPMHLYEQLFADGMGMMAQPATNPVHWRCPLNASCIEAVGFTREEGLLPYDARSFQGYRLLQEYFAFPQRFMFVKLTGLQEAMQRCEQDQLDLIIFLGKINSELEATVSADNFKLFCTPAANLFSKGLDRIHVSDKVSEFHVVPDRTRPLDFEVHGVSEVLGYGERSDQMQEFRPFYSAKDIIRKETGGYFVTHRMPRSRSQRERAQGRRSSSYAGSEVYLSLVDARAVPYATDMKQLGVKALCTNRDLPLHMPTGMGSTDFTLDKTAPCRSIRCLGSPTAPQQSHAGGPLTWRAVSHLSLNYYSLSDNSNGQGAAALRDILKLYCGPGEAQPKQIEGLKSVTCQPIVRRITAAQSIAFVRGTEVVVTLEEALFIGTGVFLLGAVLERFFAKYVSINTFTETVIRTVERGEIMRWRSRKGMRPTL